MAEFTDAQAMHALHPDSFEVPSYVELAALMPGDHIKVCAGDERFWVKITHLYAEGKERELTGTVGNHLLNGKAHGLAFGDSVTVRPEHVYAILNG